MQYFIDALHQYSVYEYLWFFMIYSVGGWCLEVSYHVVTTGHFVNRGFLNGPVCPIYGFGMLLVIICLLPLEENKPTLFFGSIILATLLELAVGFLLEKIFHERWWDYSNEPFNFKGYICLKFSIQWGIACLIVVDVVHVFFAGIIEHFPKTAGIVLIAVCLTAFAADCIATVITIKGFNRRLRLMNDVGERMRKLSEYMGEDITEATLHGIEKSNQIKEHIDDKKHELSERSAAVRNEIDERSSELKEHIEIKRSRSLAERAGKKAQIEAELAALRVKMEKLRSVGRIGQRRLLRAFPDMKNAHFQVEIEQLKKAVAEGRKRKKK